MKITTTTGAFVPITMSITFESPDELRSLWAYLDDSELIQDMLEDDILDLQDLWDAVDGVMADHDIKRPE